MASQPLWKLWNARLDRVYRALCPAGARRAIRKSIASWSSLGADLRRKLQHTFVELDGESRISFYFDNFYSAFTESEQHTILRENVQFELPVTLSENHRAPSVGTSQPRNAIIVAQEVPAYKLGQSPLHLYVHTPPASQLGESMKFVDSEYAPSVDTFW